MKKLWNSLVNWFERGDLVPLLVVVSAWHYIKVLESKDPWFIAVPIGLLADLSHFRTVRAAVRYGKPEGRKVQWLIRWAVAAAMTAVAFVYHLRYYENDIWLAAPVPVLIAVLAWLSKVDANIGPKPAGTVPPKPAQVPKAAAKFTAECKLCEWKKNGYETAKSAQQAENAHARGRGHKERVKEKGQ